MERHDAKFTKVNAEQSMFHGKFLLGENVKETRECMQSYVKKNCFLFDRLRFSGEIVDGENCVVTESVPGRKKTKITKNHFIYTVRDSDGKVDEFHEDNLEYDI